MKKIICVFLALTFLFTLTSCGGTKSFNFSSDSKDVLISQKQSDPVLLEDTEITDVSQDKKIIKNAFLNLEAEDVKETYQKILSYVKKKGGYEFSKSQSTRNGYNVVEATLKLAPDFLEDFIQYVEGICGVINCRVESQDISDEYFDAQTRLKSARESLETYYKILNNAKTVEDVLKVQERIDKVIADIEALEGKINMWDEQVAQSRITLTINEISDPLKPKEQINWNALGIRDMGILIRNGFMTVANYLVSAIQWIIIVLISALPLLLIAGVVVFIIKKRKKKKMNKQE